MPYTLIWYVDGGCRGNGDYDAIGAAAAVRETKYRKWIYKKKLPYDGTRHTNQRAELLAIIIALKKSLKLYRQLDGTPYLELTIHSDSRYAVDCMTKWTPRARNDTADTACNEILDEMEDERYMYF
ncbi:hypothetical protein CB0940_10329 [Cercospora beticola]|uniref:RNase H type-1 domain-containing protein n=1 Tax=Cercospora beticola TaxID=122368 RepID=A0A2G5HUD3_CERBT|nr:hypothetical protein CB0940_10329 [Cercospora beticola]PIA96149.1 hypothetical protein CB0940_10329 [Cercospora beticola]WPB07038.1 hypothetical protein RHO25_011698 [Cercospora beticola]